jgi:hypothetical protein
MADDSVYADLLDSLSPLTTAGIDPDQARMDRAGTMAKLTNSGVAAPWWEQPQQGQQGPTQMASATPPPQPSAVPAGVTPSGKPSLADNNAGTIGLMQSDYAKASKDVDAEANQPDLATTTAPLQTQRTKDATAINAYDPQTGKVLDKYKPSFGQRLMRGVEGFAGGGILGAIDPKLGGAEAYGAPSQQYGRDVQQQQGRVASDDQQLKNAADNWKATSDRLKQIANERRALATAGKDVTGASNQQQQIPIDKEKADTGQEEAYNNSPEGKAEAAKQLSAETLTSRAAQADQMKLAGTNRVLFMANGKIPDPRQATAEEIAQAQATKVFTLENGHPPQTLADYTKIRQAAKGEAGGATMMVPDGKGGFNATIVRPGDNVPAGTTTAAGMAAAGKGADKEAKAAKQVVDDAETAHELAREAENGNAPADVDLALQFFKTMKGTSGAGIRFTQTENNLIMGARNSAGDLLAVAQKVIGSGQPLEKDQRDKMLKVIDIHADAARKHLDSGDSSSDSGNTPPPGAKVRDYSTLRPK